MRPIEKALILYETGRGRSPKQVRLKAAAFVDVSSASSVQAHVPKHDLSAFYGRSFLRRSVNAIGTYLVAEMLPTPVKRFGTHYASLHIRF
jgi:hypothetical protein